MSPSTCSPLTSSQATTFLLSTKQWPAPWKGRSLLTPSPARRDFASTCIIVGSCPRPNDVGRGGASRASGGGGGGGGRRITSLAYELAYLDATDHTTTTTKNSFEIVSDDNAQYDLEDISGSAGVGIDLDAFHYRFLRYVTDSLHANNLALARLTTQQKDALLQCLNQDYTEVLLLQSSSPQQQGDSTEISAHVAAAHHILHEYAATRQVFALHFCKSSSKTFETAPAPLLAILDRIHAFLRPRLLLLYADNSHGKTEQNRLTLTPGDAAKLLGWMFFLQQQAVSAGWTQQEQDHAAVQDWHEDIQALLKHYIHHGVHVVLRQHLTNLLSLSISNGDDDVQQFGYVGHIFTDQPEQVMHLLEAQLAVAGQALPTSLLGPVWNASLLEIHHMIGEHVMFIQRSWMDEVVISIKRFCATINDAARLAEYIERRNDSVCVDQERDDSGDVVNEVLRELAELSLLACRLLCERVMTRHLVDPADPVLALVGTHSWEKHFCEESNKIAEETAAHVVERTGDVMVDLLTDVEQWLHQPDYYLPKILKIFFDLTLQTYVESFFVQTLAHGVGRANAASRALKRDATALLELFHQDAWSLHHGIAGMDSSQVLNMRVSLLQSMARLVDPSVPADDALLEDVVALLKQCTDGPAAMLHLVSLRHAQKQNKTLVLRNQSKNHLPQQATKTAWMRLLAHAEQAVEQDNRTSQHALVKYRLPDLRNSSPLQLLLVLRKTSSSVASSHAFAAMGAHEKSVERASRSNPLAASISNTANTILSTTWHSPMQESPYQKPVTISRNNHHDHDSNHCKDFVYGLSARKERYTMYTVKPRHHGRRRRASMEHSSSHDNRMQYLRRNDSSPNLMTIYID